MKGLISIVIVIFFFVLPQAQIYVVGDTTGRYAYYPEYAFPDNSVSIHIDCDDSPDLVFNSNIVPENYNDCPRRGRRTAARPAGRR